MKLVANISYQNTGSTAEIVVSWHPGWEEVETDRGNGGEVLSTRAKNSVLALIRLNIARIANAVHVTI